jgi:CYTH domain
VPPGVPFVRLRTVGDQHTFTLKRPAENALSCDEYETVVADRQQMGHAILAMGFYPTVRIAKVRRTATLDGLVLCVDEVAGRPSGPRRRTTPWCEQRSPRSWWLIRVLCGEAGFEAGEVAGSLPV